MKNPSSSLEYKNLEELSVGEMKVIFGGDPLSEGVFYLLGIAFEYLDRAARRGAPRGNIYKHSG